MPDQEPKPEPPPEAVVIRLEVLPRGTARDAPEDVPWGRRLAQLLKSALRYYGFRAEIIEDPRHKPEGDRTC